MRRTQSLAGIAVIAAWGLILAPLAHAVVAPGDEGPSDPAVIDNTGAARFRIPIEVPPGPGGFAPHLELAYSSRSGDGPFGIGWSLGIPEIHCSDRFGIPNYANCAQYELGSVLLVKDPQNPNAYHTFVESFQRIRFVPATQSWTVEQPNGTKLIFGELPSHRISQGGSTARWLLQRMEDSFQNKIYFEYDTAMDAGSAYLVHVFYGVGASRVTGPREVRLDYPVRPDTRTLYAGGLARKISHRLGEIQVFGHAQLFKRYVFSYDLPGVTYATDRSRLSSVKEYGTDCTAADPSTCTSLPPQTFHYRDSPGLYDNNDGYRVPFGLYPGTVEGSPWKHKLPQLIGDINGDGLPDRLELRPSYLGLYDLYEPGVMVVWINTGTGFSNTNQQAAGYQASFDNLTYDQPGLDYQQIPSPRGVAASVFHLDMWPQSSMYAMCSVTPRTRQAILSHELSYRGVKASTSSLATLQASAGLPSAGYFEPRPSVKLVDLDADGRADLVVSVRLSGVDRHFDCNGTPLANPEHILEQSVAVVFRNNGSGWVNDDAAKALAKNLPPFEEVIVKSSYQTEYDEPSITVFTDNGGNAAGSPCANYSYLGFEWNPGVPNAPPGPPRWTAVCHVPIDLSPQFVDFNGDGLPDIAVIHRDNPDLLWTGANPNLDSPVRNYARTWVWIQTPNDASQRWTRAPQYDLPYELFPINSMNSIMNDGGGFGFAHVRLFHDTYENAQGIHCWSWKLDFTTCGPTTYTADLGVRIADMNGDGLADVVWNTGGGSTGSPSGVLLNTGGGAARYSAWCASNHDDALRFGGSECPEAAVYAPPQPLVLYVDLLGQQTVLGQTVGWLRDVNGDGLLDLVRARIHTFSESWLQSPSGPTRWRHDDSRFDYPINWDIGMTNPIIDQQIRMGIGSNDFLTGFQIFDVNGDGSADVVGDQQALLSRSRDADLIASVDNGRGGVVVVEYAPATLQRTSALDQAADSDVQQEKPDGGDSAPWRPTPVVSRIRVTGSGFADAITDYRYAHPRYCSAYRSDLGFRLVEKTRPDGSTVEEYFYQDHGRAGHASKRLVKDAVQVVDLYQASWELAPSTILGSIPGVFVGRLKSEESSAQYGTASGSLQKRILTYDDTYGYNFVSGISTERPTGTLVDTRTPVPDPEATPYVVGRTQRRILTNSAATVLRDTTLTYVDLAGHQTGPKLGARTEFVAQRGAAGGQPVDVIKLRYDIYGNRIEEWTPNPAQAGGGRSTLFCYDGDACPSSPPNQSSHSVMVSSQDPAGKSTRFTPDAGSGIIVGTSSDYVDEPATRTVLDPFGRPKSVKATPSGGAGEVLVAENRYDDTHGPLRVEHFEYADATASESQSIYSAEIFGSFGGVWKTIGRTNAATPYKYSATLTFSNPTSRKTRTTVPLNCGTDATCAAFSGATDAFSRVVTTDAVGRPVRIDTPDGSSLLAYRSVANRWGGLGSLDGVLEKNGKGDLVDRALDGDRTAWVDECHLGVAASVSSLGSVTCGVADTTRYFYEATGEIRIISDARAVATSNFSDSNRRLRYTYDTLGRIVRIEDPDLEGSGHSSATYSDAGSVATTTNARGQVQTFGYDILGRLIGVDAPPGEDDYTVGYRSNEWQRWKDSSSAYERERTYDGWGRLKQTHLSVVEDVGPVGEGTWSGSYFMDFEYDVAGRTVKVVYPESTKVRYEYEGAFLKRVCDLGNAANCSDPSVVQYVSGVTYDTLGRRANTVSAAGTRTFTYDGSLARLKVDRFDAKPTSPPSSDAYYFQLNYDAYDEVGNLTSMRERSQPADIDMDQSFQYDPRNRLASWTKQGTTYAYGYDDLGNLTSNANSAQLFNAPTRPHSLESRASGGAIYAHDFDGNVTSIVSPSGSRYFQFDSANHLTCADTVPGGCALNKVHYDVDGRRVLDDSPQGMTFVAFPDDSVTLDGGLSYETRIEIYAFGERIAYKRSAAGFRTTGELGGAPFGLPPEALPWLAGLGLLGLLAGLARRGSLVLVLERPGYAGVSAVLVVALVLGPVPGARVSKAGGGGGASFYWELADRLGTGMVMLDETGARRVHRTYSPFGVEQASVGTGSWLPQHYAGHPKDEDSGLLYMQARWMDAQSGTFLSVDPVVADAGDPQAFNAYAYARNNPQSFTDPTGELFDWDLHFLTLPGISFLALPGIYPLTNSEHQSPPAPQAYPADALGSPLAGMNTGGGGRPQYQGEIQLASLKGTTELVVGPILPLVIPGAGAIRGAEVVEEGISAVRAARAIGRAGEEAAGIVRNTSRIPSLTGTARFRVPDALTATTLKEVKNVRNLALTNQIRDFAAFAKQTGRAFELVVRPNTVLSGPLQSFIRSEGIVLRTLP